MKISFMGLMFGLLDAFSNINEGISEISASSLWIYGMVCVEMDEFYISQQVHNEMNANRRHVGDGFGPMYVFGTHVCVYIIRN